MFNYLKQLFGSFNTINGTVKRKASIPTLEPLKLMSGSTIEIFATGDEGFEIFDLLIDDVVVERFENISTNGGVFTFETESPVEANQIRIAFVNDVFDPDNEIDANLNVDRIVVDGQTFQTESPTTFATGVYTGNDFVPGFHQSETLHTNGFFQFDAGPEPQPEPTPNDGVEINVIARGTEGGELLVVQDAQGQELDSFIVTTDFETYSLTTSNFVIGDNLRIAFLNDLFDPVNGIDRNLIIDRIEVDGVSIETSNTDAVSIGTFRPNVDFVVGIQEAEILLDNAFFEFQTAPANTVSSLIEVNARGEEGTEIIRILSNGILLSEFELTTSLATYTIDTTNYSPGSEIQIEFINDVFDPDNGVDANLFVDSVSVNGQINQRSEFLFTNGTVSYAF